MNDNAPHGSLAEMEQAQATLRDGIERARKLLREAKVEIGGLDPARPELPDFPRAQAE